MIEVYIGNAFEPKKVITVSSVSLKQLYEENHIAVPAGSVVTLGVRRLSDEEFDNSTLAQLGVRSGDLITFTQKLNGAR